MSELNDRLIAHTAAEPPAMQQQTIDEIQRIVRQAQQVYASPAARQMETDDLIDDLLYGNSTGQSTALGPLSEES